MSGCPNRDRGCCPSVLPREASKWCHTCRTWGRDTQAWIKAVYMESADRESARIATAYRKAAGIA